MIFSPMNRDEEEGMRFSGTPSELKNVIAYIRECCCPLCGRELEEHYGMIGGENMLVHISCPNGDYAYDVD